ncbi:Bifunctional DNA primase/polymerase, N-terminal [Loktanella fryxellensis]|uniref:Bifunctional DNA primase/polymerase, N-terminal n=1 Tax=Loktanella fryxellensis TaxID=245187 RepID=A0A1H8IXE6_9RHOB|nr:Bifunctional DNA primase/polymerase, N-terminal [Loktanella fryxellensis]
MAIGRPEGAGQVTFANAAEQLLDNGYEPIPIKPGQKAPALSRWTSVQVDEAAIATWRMAHGSCGVGLRTGRLVGVDIDILDPDRAHAAQALATLRFGETLMRVGCWPKRLLLYRTQSPFAKMKSGQIEILGLGQQFVAFGLHPGTGRPYSWPLGETPLEVPLSDLPVIDLTAAAAFLAEIGPTGQRSERGSRSGRQTPAGTGDPVRDAQGLVIDGRDGWLSSCAYHAVWDAIDAGGAPDADLIALQTWMRFEATSDLLRPKQDGAACYDIDDALWKVRDKLRLHANDALPSRDRPEIAPDYAVPTLTVLEARSQLDAEIAGFAEATYAWHVAGGQDEPPKLALRATVGLGKSAISRQHLSALQTRLRDAGLPHRIVVFVASHALAEEAAAAWEETGVSVAVLRGYERKEPGTGRPMCKNLKSVKAAIANRRDIQRSACQKNLSIRCPYFAGCPKQENRRQVSLADVVVAPYDAMFHKLAGTKNGIALVIVDEACWQRAPKVLPGLSLGSLAAEFLSSGRTFGSPIGRAARAADLAALRQHLHAALARSGPGPLKRAACQDEGLDAQACRAAVELEEQRLRSSSPTAGQAEERVKEIIEASLWNERVYTMIDLWTALETFLEGETTHCPTIRVGDVNPNTGDSAIVCSQLRTMDNGFARLPGLHLDATFRSALATPVLGPMREITIDAAAPHMAVTLIPGAFGKGRLVEGLEFSPGHQATARSGSLLARCIDYVRLVALACGKEEEILVVTNKDIEPVFWGLPKVSTAHFNAVAGIDAWKDVRTLIVIGRPLPRDSDVATLAGVHLGADAAGEYHATAAGLWMRDSTPRTVRVLRHEDPMAEVIRAAICDDELIQVIGRGRGVNRTAQNPLDVHILADVALPLVHDRIVPWDSIQPGIFERMLLEGAAVDSPSDAFALHPQMFSSLEQAKSVFRRALFKGQTPYIYIRGLTLKSAQYRRRGRGRSWQMTWWIDGDAATVQRQLGSVLGDLAEWRPE